MKRRLSPKLAVGEDDRGRGGERAAAGDADQRRIGEGVAEQSLHDRAGHREQAADHRGGRDPRNPDRPQHELVARDMRMRRASADKAERGRKPGQRNARGAYA